MTIWSPIVVFNICWEIIIVTTLVDYQTQRRFGNRSTTTVLINYRVFLHFPFSPFATSFWTTLSYRIKTWCCLLHAQKSQERPYTMVQRKRRRRELRPQKWESFEKGRASDGVRITARVLNFNVRILKGIGQQLAEESLVIAFGLLHNLQTSLYSRFTFSVIIIK